MRSSRVGAAHQKEPVEIELTRVHPGDTLGEVYWAYPVWRRPRADSRAAGENTFPAGLGRP